MADFNNFSSLPEASRVLNFNTFKGNNDAYFVEQDCYTVDISRLSKFNIYMYDGDHNGDSHYKALIHYYECLDDMFVFIVDDWNYNHVRSETLKSLKQLGLSVLYEREIRLTNDGSHTRYPLASDTWHNGIYVAFLQKIRASKIKD